MMCPLCPGEMSKIFSRPVQVEDSPEDLIGEFTEAERCFKHQRAGEMLKHLPFP